MGLDLLCRLLSLHPGKRTAGRFLLDHPWFSEVGEIIRTRYKLWNDDPAVRSMYAILSETKLLPAAEVLDPKESSHPTRATTTATTTAMATATTVVDATTVTAKSKTKDVSRGSRAITKRPETAKPPNDVPTKKLCSRSRSPDRASGKQKPQGGAKAAAAQRPAGKRRAKTASTRDEK